MPEPHTTGRIAPYAWMMLASSFVTTALVFGVWFSFAVLFVAMLEEFPWSRGGAALAFAVGNLVQAALSPLIGLLTDRWGPRRIIVSGCLIAAAGLAACALVQALWHFTVFFGVAVGLGVALAGPVSHSALLAAWFVRRRGTIIGFSFAGMGLGVKIVGPLAQYLILALGWRSTFLVLALCTAGYALLIALTLRNSPHDVGLRPYGAHTPPVMPQTDTAVERPPRPEWTVAQAVRTREFWALSPCNCVFRWGFSPSRCIRWPI